LSIDAQLSREWLAVNRLGGYAASTVPGDKTGSEIKKGRTFVKHTRKVD